MTNQNDAIQKNNKKTYMNKSISEMVSTVNISFEFGILANDRILSLSENIIIRNIGFGMAIAMSFDIEGESFYHHHALIIVDNNFDCSLKRRSKLDGYLGRTQVRS